MGRNRSQARCGQWEAPTSVREAVNFRKSAADDPQRNGRSGTRFPTATSPVPGRHRRRGVRQTRSPYPQLRSGLAVIPTPTAGIDVRSPKNGCAWTGSSMQANTSSRDWHVCANEVASCGRMNPAGSGHDRLPVQGGEDRCRPSFPHPGCLLAQQRLDTVFARISQSLRCPVLRQQGQHGRMVQVRADDGL